MHHRLRSMFPSAEQFIISTGWCATGRAHAWLGAGVGVRVRVVSTGRAWCGGAHDWLGLGVGVGVGVGSSQWGARGAALHTPGAGEEGEEEGRPRR